MGTYGDNKMEDMQNNNAYIKDSYFDELEVGKDTEMRGASTAEEQLDISEKYEVAKDEAQDRYETFKGTQEYYEETSQKIEDMRASYRDENELGNEMDENELDNEMDENESDSEMDGSESDSGMSGSELE